MRSDYGLYIIAIVCFVLASFLFIGYKGNIQLTTGNKTTDLVLAMFSAVLGVVVIGLGYAVKPKKVILPLPKPATEKPKKVPEKKEVKKQRPRKKT